MKVLRALGLRLWPYGAGLMLCLLIGLAERQSRHASAFGEGVPLLDWLALRVAGPWHLAVHDPAEGWLAWVLLALLPLYAIRPRWWLAPPTMGILVGWCFWGTRLVGHMA